MTRKVLHRPAIPFLGLLAAMLLLFSGCHEINNDVDLLSLDLDQYQPIEEFAKAYESISFYEQQQENAPYDIEQTIRVINAMEIAQVQSENFEEFLDYMARQDYTGVAPEVLEAKRKLFPLMEYTYKLQQSDEQMSDLWMLMRSAARGGESLMSDITLSKLLLMMHSDVFALLGIVAGGDADKAINEVFDQYSHDKALKAKVEKDLQRLRISYRNYLESYVPIYKKYMEEYDALCLEKDQAYFDLYGGRVDNALTHTENILRKYPNNPETMLLESMALILKGSENTLPMPAITLNDKETNMPYLPDTLKRLNDRPIIPMNSLMRKADGLLEQYTLLYPDRTAPALVLEGLLYQQLGDEQTALNRFHQASVEYPRQAERLTDMLDIYNTRVYLTKTPEGQYLRRLYASTMEGYGLFSPNLLKARYYAAQGDMEASRKEIYNHFFRRGNQGIYDELLSDMQFCEDHLYGPFKSLLIEQSYIDVSVEPETSWIFWESDDVVRVKITNRSDLRLENVRVFLCIHYTDMFKDEYDVVKVSKTQNIIEPHSTADLDTLLLRYPGKDYNDITRIRAIAMTDDRICWVDEVNYKQSRVLASRRGEKSDISQQQIRSREEYLSSNALQPEKLKELLESQTRVLPPDDDPTVEKSFWESVTGWFKRSDNTLHIELPRTLAMIDPIFSLRQLDAQDALLPDDNYLTGTAVHLHFDYEPELDETIPLYIYTEEADFRVDICYRGKDSLVTDVTIERR